MRPGLLRPRLVAGTARVGGGPVVRAVEGGTAVAEGTAGRRPRAAARKRSVDLPELLVHPPPRPQLVQVPALAGDRMQYPPATSSWMDGLGPSIQRTHSSTSCHCHGCGPLTRGTTASWRMRTGWPGGTLAGSTIRARPRVSVTVRRTAASLTPSGSYSPDSPEFSSAKAIGSSGPGLVSSSDESSPPGSVSSSTRGSPATPASAPILAVTPGRAGGRRGDRSRRGGRRGRPPRGRSPLPGRRRAPG